MLSVVAALVKAPMSRALNLQLTDEQTEALIQGVIPDHRERSVPSLSPRIRVLRDILGQLRPEPVREPYPRCNITSRRAKADTGGARRARQ